MITRRVYRVDNLQVIGEALVRLAAGADPDPTATKLVFRAVHSQDWWVFDTNESNWLRSTSTGWKIDTPYEALEGQSPLPVHVPRDRWRDFEPAEGPDTSVHRLSIGVNWVRARWLDGSSDNLVSTAKLMTLAICTRKGVWTTGVWSGDWYCHSGERWLVSRSAPDQADVLRHHEILSLSKDSTTIRALDSLTSRSDLPEEISSNFVPPYFDREAPA